MSRKAFGGAFVAAFALSGTLMAQSTPQGATQQPAAHTADAKTVTVEGCLVREADVPGRQPNVAERAGVAQDFILTHAKIKEGSGAAAQTGTATGATGTTGAGQTAGTTGSALKMFEVRGIDSEELKRYVGQRVEIVGKLDPQDAAERQREQASPTGEPAGDLPELEGSSIKKSSNTEPCTPAAK